MKRYSIFLIESQTRQTGWQVFRQALGRIRQGSEKVPVYPGLWTGRSSAKWQLHRSQEASSREHVELILQMGEPRKSLFRYSQNC